MNTSWLVWVVAYALSGNPLVALIAVGLFLWLGEGWWHGRLWKPWSIVQQWMRIRELRAHVTLAPHDLTARGDLGRLLVERGRPEEAIPHLEAVVARLPDLAFPQYHLGLARLATGDLEGGRTAIEKALTIRKDLHYGLPLVKIGDWFAERTRWAEALVYYERAEGLHASSVEILYKLGRARQATGDAAGAAQALRDAVAVYESAPPFKRRQERTWGWRAWWAARSVKAEGARAA